jgi:hypothetical protein
MKSKSDKTKEDVAGSEERPTLVIYDATASFVFSLAPSLYPFPLAFRLHCRQGFFHSLQTFFQILHAGGK